MRIVLVDPLEMHEMPAGYCYADLLSMQRQFPRGIRFAMRLHHGSNAQSLVGVHAVQRADCELLAVLCGGHV